TELATVRGEIERHRVAAAEMRAEAQALAREAELAERRLGQIAEDCGGRRGRKGNAPPQNAAPAGPRRGTQTRSRAAPAAPAAFAEKRQALIGQIENAEAARRTAADHLAAAENALAEADRAARSALEAMGTARADAARAEERFDGAKRRLADIAHEIREMLEVEPEAVVELAELKPGAELPEVAEIEKTLDRIRRERERLGAVNLP